MEIKTVGILGFGTMGRQIAQLCAENDFDVVVMDIDEEIIKEGFADIQMRLRKALEKGKITEDKINEVISKIKVASNIDELCDRSQYIIEVIPEDLELKKRVFRELDSKTGNDVILASNTSSLPITHIASATSKPERIIGAHFFQPLHVMKLAEVVVGALTSEETVQVTRNLLEKLGRVVVLVKDNGKGFPSVRLSHALFREAMQIVEEGVASPEDVDKILKYGYGYPMGPFELTDWIGLDMRAKIWDEMYKLTNDPKWVVPPLMKLLIISGYVGNPKTRKGSKGGFYEYFKSRMRE